MPTEKEAKQASADQGVGETTRPVTSPTEGLGGEATTTSTGEQVTGLGAGQRNPTALDTDVAGRDSDLLREEAERREATAEKKNYSPMRADVGYLPRSRD